MIAERIARSRWAHLTPCSSSCAQSQSHIQTSAGSNRASKNPADHNAIAISPPRISRCQASCVTSANAISTPTNNAGSVMITSSSAAAPSNPTPGTSDGSSRPPRYGQRPSVVLATSRAANPNKLAIIGTAPTQIRAISSRLARRPRRTRCCSDARVAGTAGSNARPHSGQFPLVSPVSSYSHPKQYTISFYRSPSDMFRAHRD